MNTFIQWQETISDAYLTYTPSYFPFIQPNTSLLPQGSLASIPSNALIVILLYTDHMQVMMNDDLGQYSVRSRLPQNYGIPLNQVIPQSPVIPQSLDIKHFLSIRHVFRKVQLAREKQRQILPTCILQPHPVSCIVQTASCNPHPATHILHPATCTLHPPMEIGLEFKILTLWRND